MIELLPDPMKIIKLIRKGLYVLQFKVMSNRFIFMEPIVDIA